jgi:hypothetical protein
MFTSTFVIITSLIVVLTKELCDIPPNSSSKGFEQTCRSLSHQIKFEEIYFHSILDFHRPSSIALLKYQICQADLLCIPKSNFRIILHLPKDATALSRIWFREARLYLLAKSIHYIVWTDEFTSASSQRARKSVLKDLNYSQNAVIVQLDADEFFARPAVDLISRARLILTGQCDYYHGVLEERLPIDGALLNISLLTPLRHQFPLVCRVKDSVERAATRKVVLYRASFRPDVGNHDLLCGRRVLSSSCRAFLRDSGMEESSLHADKLNSLRPVRCPGDLISIDHYKYIDGVQSYLTRRVSAFLRAGIPWHRESSQVLRYLQLHNNSICTSCPDVNCRFDLSRISLLDELYP